ncbi:MAG: type II toxin-antitoxin system VapC family toxin [Thermomicrobiales bacterium]
MIILLDSGPLGLVTSPRVTAASEECSLWLERITNGNHLVVIPEIVDYELRREFLRGRMTRALTTLDAFAFQFIFSPITTPVMRQAAAFWAFARQRGMATADDKALDGDMILAAQAVLIEQEWEQVAVIATTNVRHLARFAAARDWRDIR